MKTFYFSSYHIIPMKRMVRGICLLGILLISFVNINPAIGDSNNRRVIYTAITNISLTNIPGPELCENCSHFDFIYDYDILNPRIRKLTLQFSCSGINLMPNISAIFENNHPKRFEPVGFLF